MFYHLLLILLSLVEFMLKKHIKLFDFIENKELYEFKVQIFAVSQLYLFLLGMSTLLVQVFITHNQEISGNSFWIGLSLLSLFNAEVCIRLNNNLKALKLFTNFILSFLSFIVIPFGVWLSASITTPSIIYVFVGIALVSLLASKRYRIVLNSYIIIFCIFFIYIEMNNPSLLQIEKPIYEENLVDWAIIFVGVLVFFNTLISSIRKLIEKNTKTIIEQSNKLYLMSISDYLTQLYNKKYLYEVLDVLVNDLEDKGESFILISLDIDYFKIYNDTYGHIEGDICLKEVASIFKATVDENVGYAFRFGGEEFIIALKSSTIDYGISLINSINDNLVKKGIENINSPISSYLSLSYGMILFSKEDNHIHSVDYLLKTLDNALYKAKENGRNQCYSFDGEKFYKVDLLL